MDTQLLAKFKALLENLERLAAAQDALREMRIKAIETLDNGQNEFIDANHRS